MPGTVLGAGPTVKDRLGLCPGHLTVPWRRQCQILSPTLARDNKQERGGGETWGVALRK